MITKSGINHDMVLTSLSGKMDNHYEATNGPGETERDTTCSSQNKIPSHTAETSTDGDSVSNPHLYTSWQFLVVFLVSTETKNLEI